MPDAFIGVDVIVGTRGETEACFAECHEFLENLPFSQLHVFSYSERPGTMALRITPVVPADVKHARSRTLLDLSERKLHAFYDAHIGKTATVLFEHARKGGKMYGFTANYIKVEKEKKRFNGAKPGDVIIFNPKKAYPESDIEISSLLKIKKEEAADVTADFSYQITEITRFMKAPIDQTLFDNIYGKDAVKSVEEFRKKIGDGMTEQLKSNSDYKFLLDLRAYCEKKVGKLKFPDALLKRVMLQNNKDKGAEFVDKNFDASIKELEWHLIKEQLVAATGIKVEDADVRAAAKLQARIEFSRYGMSNVPEEYLDNYAAEMLKKREAVDGFVDRAVDYKLTEALKKVVKLNVKKVSLDEFNKMMQEK